MLEKNAKLPRIILISNLSTQMHANPNFFQREKTVSFCVCCSSWAFKHWKRADKDAYGKNMLPLNSAKNGAYLIILQITTPDFCTFIFELKNIVIPALWETLRTMEKREKPIPYSALPASLHKFLVDSRVIFATCDGRNDMEAIERFCGIRSRKGQPGGDGQIGFVDVQEWAVDMNLLQLGKPDLVSGLRQKHPPSPDSFGRVRNDWEIGED